MTDPRWQPLHAARGSLIDEFADQGVDHVEYVVALPKPDLWVWLGTDTDVQRDALAGTSGLLERVRGVLAERVPGIVVTGVSVESAETVQRDFRGSWFYVLR